MFTLELVFGEPVFIALSSLPHRFVPLLLTFYLGLPHVPTLLTTWTPPSAPGGLHILSPDLPAFSHASQFLGTDDPQFFQIWQLLQQQQLLPEGKCVNPCSMLNHARGVSNFNSR